MRAVDTNVLVRLIVRDDPKQYAAAERYIERGAWVPHLAIAELSWVLATVYQRGSSEIATAVEMLLEHRSLILQEADVVLAALDDFRKRPSVEFSDCLLLEIARKAGHLPLGTLDRRLTRLSGTESVASA